ncbi:MAG: DSD1 family PLP-dependent enzyme [Acidobacteriia bacterium]|nr:DSD1 family PLP-dependent enzyme [Terriglobia bacterium]
MQTRRQLLTAAAVMAAPAILKGAKGYTWAEVEKILASGKVQGRLTKDDLPTPALLLNMDAFEANVKKMSSYVLSRGRGFRPHGKTHKCPNIAHHLVKNGAVGTCAAKLSEAEVFSANGLQNLLVTTAVVGKYKIERAMRLATRRPDTIFVVDNTQNLRDMNDAAAAGKIKLNLAVDLLVGNRTGIRSGDPAVALVEAMQSLSNVRFQGLQAYAGHASHVIGFEPRKKKSGELMGEAVETRRMLEKKGIACNWLSGGSTGTYNIDSEIDGVTELQPGSFMFMDVDYNRIGGSDGNAHYSDFANSLTVMATVVSKPTDSIAIVDAGLKAFSTDKPFPPETKDKMPVTYAYGGDEHGKLTLGQGAHPFQVGDKLEFIIPHCDPSVNLYDKIFCVRGDKVEATWAIAARGMSQ